MAWNKHVSDEKPQTRKQTQYPELPMMRHPKFSLYRRLEVCHSFELLLMARIRMVVAYPP